MAGTWPGQVCQGSRGPNESCMPLFAVVGGRFWKAEPRKWEGIAERKRGRDLASGKASEMARGRSSGVTC